VSVTTELPPLRPASPALLEPAQRLAARFGLTLRTQGEVLPSLRSPFELVLDQSGLRLDVLPEGYSEFGRHPLQVDFVGDRRFRQPLRVGDPLAKAIGLRAGQRPDVGDLSGGLGRDAWAIASLGCRVIVCERHPVVAALLEDGLRRATMAAVPMVAQTAARIRLHIGEASDLLVSPSQVLYFDPMFPERVKSALVKKEMRIFRAVVGEDPDASGLFEKARVCGCRRLVVKRPRHAPPLGDRLPSHHIESSRLRFDIYFP